MTPLITTPLLFLLPPLLPTPRPCVLLLRLVVWWQIPAYSRTFPHSAKTDSTILPPVDPKGFFRNSLFLNNHHGASSLRSGGPPERSAA